MTKWDKYFMNVAFETAKLSYATRLKVGAVAVKDRRIIGCGFNGTAPGRDNVCECNNVTKDEVLHAERNLICWSAKNGIALDGCSMYVTHSPCLICSSMILASGFNHIYYTNEYRTREGLDFLVDSGVLLTRME